MRGSLSVGFAGGRSVDEEDDTFDALSDTTDIGEVGPWELEEREGRRGRIVSIVSVSVVLSSSDSLTTSMSSSGHTFPSLVAWRSVDRLSSVAGLGGDESGMELCAASTSLSGIIIVRLSHVYTREEGSGTGRHHSKRRTPKVGSTSLRLTRPPPSWPPPSPAV
jgi:hypothetical protein